MNTTTLTGAIAALKPCPFCGSTDIDPEGVAYINPDSKVKDWDGAKANPECIKHKPACNNCSATADDWQQRAQPEQGDAVVGIEFVSMDDEFITLKTHAGHLFKVTYPAALSRGPDARGDVLLPDDVLDHVQHIGRAEWGTTKDQTDAEHVCDFAVTLRKTREHFGTGEMTALQSVYIEGDAVVICHTGTGPNAGKTARAITGLWNYIHDLALARKSEA